MKRSIVQCVLVRLGQIASLYFMTSVALIMVELSHPMHAKAMWKSLARVGRKMQC